MIKKENKLIQITLDPENLKLLNSLADRFHISKTETIKQALKLFGASKNHHYTIHLTDSKKAQVKENLNDVDCKDLIEEIENL